MLTRGHVLSARVIEIDREERRLGLAIKAENDSSQQLATETTAYEQHNLSAPTKL